jgi:PAS domain S-box-containing protein
MAKKPDASTDVTAFREKAEELLRLTKRDIAAMPVKDVQRLVRDLQVYQIELEMQNDELRRTEAELEAARNRYVDLYEFSPAGHLTLDTHGTIVEGNPRAATVLGLNRNGLVGQSLVHFIASDDQDLLHRHRQEVLKTGTRQTCEVRLRNDAQVSRWLYLESLAVHDEPGLITHWRTALLDITERKRTEQELRESEARFRAILENSQGMVFLKDIEGRYLHVNRRFERAFHVTCKQVVGKTDEAIFAPEQAAAFRANDRKVLQGGGPLEFEEVAMHDDGPHTSIVSKVLLYGRDGKPYALCGITTDITERKRVEEELRQSEKRYRSIFENAVEGIFQTTLDGKYITVNPALARMYGYDSPDDLIATITDVATQLYVDPRRRDEFIRLMQEQEELSGFEALVYRKDGSFIWISENVRTVRDPAGVLVGYEGTVEHITERKLAEVRLRTTLEELRMLGGRLATVEEEERTRIARELHDELGVGLTCLKIDLSRLATVVGDGMSADARANLDYKVRSMVEQVDGTIAAVQRLVTQLRPALLDSLGLVAAIEWQCQDYQKRIGIPCTFVASADAIDMEPERATALFRICQEALTNTARHAEATAVTIKLESHNDSLQLVVADNGVGIPGRKVSDRRSLGLLGMKERAASFGGVVTIQGDPGKGTIVTACLPRRLS